MKTKALVRFLNRAARFDGDVEFVDVIATAVVRGDLTPRANDKIFNYVHPGKHPRLAKQIASVKAREIVITHLKSTVHAAFIKDIYEDMSAYFADILKAAAQNGLDPGRLIGDHKFEVEANEILGCGSWDNVVELVAQKLFRKLEDEKSTMKLLEKIDAKLALNVDKKIIKGTLPYLEIRHLLVHHDGVVDEAYVKAHPHMGFNAGAKMQLGFPLVDQVRENILGLVNHYDECIVREKVVGRSALQMAPVRPTTRLSP